MSSAMTRSLVIERFSGKLPPAATMLARSRVLGSGLVNNASTGRLQPASRATPPVRAHLALGLRAIHGLRGPLHAVERGDVLVGEARGVTHTRLHGRRRRPRA